MCDTYVSLHGSSKDGSVIFGKNSDRLESEPQLITYQPRKTYSSGEMLKCTHISIPQVKETAAILLSQPYWIWGAEMGANEYGVAIGNEAVATKEPLQETGLLGMDLLRLGLERGKTAREALNVITSLLEEFGQGGPHNKKGLNYHNSFIIADLNEAFVLETAGKWWIVEIVKEYRSISNNISIRGKGDMRREGIVQHAIEMGYCKDDSDFDFKLIFSPSPLPEVFPENSRDGCSLNQLGKNRGNITPALMMDFLREHEVGICMHKRGNQSVGSQVSHLRKDVKKSIHWFTGTTIPCLSIFKPYVFPIDGQWALKPGPYDEIDSEWIWVKHHEFIAPYKKNPKKENAERDIYYKKIREIEKELINKVNETLKLEDTISEEEFLNSIKSVNKLGWDKTLEMIQ
ncbi:MAG TPA: peptidase C69 [Bacteroidetes bacterium]|nr:peptidase C69 [Bacteroidota bacterium]